MKLQKSIIESKSLLQNTKLSANSAIELLEVCRTWIKNYKATATPAMKKDKDVIAMKEMVSSVVQKTLPICKENGLVDGKGRRIKKEENITLASYSPTTGGDGEGEGNVDGCDFSIKQYRVVDTGDIVRYLLELRNSLAASGRTGTKRSGGGKEGALMRFHRFRENIPQTNFIAVQPTNQDAYTKAPGQIRQYLNCLNINGELETGKVYHHVFLPQDLYTDHKCIVYTKSKNGQVETLIKYEEDFIFPVSLSGNKIQEGGDLQFSGLKFLSENFKIEISKSGTVVKTISESIENIKSRGVFDIEEDFGKGSFDVSVYTYDSEKVQLLAGSATGLSVVNTITIDSFSHKKEKFKTAVSPVIVCGEIPFPVVEIRLFHQDTNTLIKKVTANDNFDLFKPELKGNKWVGSYKPENDAEVHGKYYYALLGPKGLSGNEVRYTYPAICYGTTSYPALRYENVALTTKKVPIDVTVMTEKANMYPSEESVTIYRNAGKASEVAISRPGDFIQCHPSNTTHLIISGKVNLTLTSKSDTKIERFALPKRANYFQSYSFIVSNKADDDYRNQIDPADVLNAVLDKVEAWKNSAYGTINATATELWEKNSGLTAKSDAGVAGFKNVMSLFSGIASAVGIAAAAPMTGVVLLCAGLLVEAFEKHARPTYPTLSELQKAGKAAIDEAIRELKSQAGNPSSDFYDKIKTFHYNNKSLTKRDLIIKINEELDEGFPSMDDIRNAMLKK